MAKNVGSSDSDKCNLKNNTTWDALYPFLGTRVRFWVHSSQIPLWHGQEEEIIADIVQEAIASTFMYTLKYSSGTKEGGVIPCNSLRHISTAIAYKQYQDWRYQESRFVYIRPHGFSIHGYVVIYERVDPLERAVDSTFQEWYCDLLAGEIAKMPDRQRTALLIDLANRLHFDAQPTQVLQRAFLKVGLRLQDYQRPLPSNPKERRGHEVLLRLAYRRIMKQQERSKEQENTEEIRVSQEPVLSNDTGPDDIESNPELAALVAHLEATAPSVVVDPAFRKALRDKLLDLLAEHHTSEAAETIPENVSEGTSEQGNAESVNSGQEPALSNDLGPKNTGSEAALASHLEAAAPLAAVDPIFRRTLREKLVGIPTVYQRPVVERALDETERILERVEETKEALDKVLEEVCPFV